MTGEENVDLKRDIDILMNMPKAEKTPVDSLVINLDRFHYHEISDRCHVINSMIDDFILAHPACSTLMNSYAVNAQSLICAVMNEAAKEEEKLD